ncbi:hypothetical protein KY285_021452 [Solanum tuberosum]|nr:hypothetical protein KY285_021452 [Solanum tuberosum]
MIAQNQLKSSHETHNSYSNNIGYLIHGERVNDKSNNSYSNNIGYLVHGNPQPPPFGCAQANMDGYLVFNEKLTAANNSKKYDTIDGGIAGVRGIVEVCTRYSMNAIVGKSVRTPILLLSRPTILAS